MAGRFELTAQAEEDLIAIWDYIALDNPNAADRLLMKFKEKFQLLADNPELGATRPDIAKEMRYLAISKLFQPRLKKPSFRHGCRNPASKEGKLCPTTLPK